MAGRGRGRGRGVVPQFIPLEALEVGITEPPPPSAPLPVQPPSPQSTHDFPSLGATSMGAPWPPLSPAVGMPGPRWPRLRSPPLLPQAPVRTEETLGLRAQVFAAPVQQLRPRVSAAQGAFAAGNNLVQDMRGLSVRGRRGREARGMADEMVRSRPDNLPTKQGREGMPLMLKSNYVPVNELKTFQLLQHHVTFEPDVVSTRFRKALFGFHKDRMGSHFIFDGAVLFTMGSIGNEEEPLVLKSVKKNEGQEVIMIVKLIKILPSTDAQMSQVLGTLIRRCMATLNLEMLGRRNYYYDMNPRNTKRIPEHGVEIASGYITTIRQFETSLLMGVFVHHKVLRTDTVLVHMNRIKDKCKAENRMTDIKERCFKDIVGEIVITRYNNKTYRVDDIDFSKKASSEWKEGETYVQYYERKYPGVRITAASQPLLVTRPKKTELRQGKTDPIYLLPEVCHMTGLSDQMRSDYRVMRSVADVTSLNPSKRVQAIGKLVQGIANTKATQDAIRGFNVGIGQNLVDVQARQLPPPEIGLAGAKTVKANSGDWQSSVRNCSLYRARNFEEIVVLYGPRDGQAVHKFCQTAQQIATSFRLQMPQPRLQQLPNSNAGTFQRALNELIATEGSKISMVMTVLPDNKADRYTAIKRLCCVDNAILSQAVLSKTISNERSLGSIASKVVQQMVVKLGGALWTAGALPSNTMIAGFDVYHDTLDKKRSAGALVCSLDGFCTVYTHYVAFHKNQEELSNNMGVGFTLALRKYHKRHGVMPARIILYRDGVGEGQIGYVKDHEVKTIRETITRLALNTKLTVILVSKRIHTQFYQPTADGLFKNPPPGTVVDNMVTNPNFYDFFLIPQASRLGTVNPVMFNVIHDENGVQPDAIQKLTYKLTHLYYNWAGTVRVPAPVQYAHKLAFLAGDTLHRQPHNMLADTAFFL